MDQPLSKIVTTRHGGKIHLRDPDNRWATRCGHAVYGPADQAQSDRSPHLHCSTCFQRPKAAPR